MVRVGDAHVGGGIRCNVCDDVIINFPIVRIQAKIYSDIGIQSLKIRNCLLVDVRLGLIGVVFCPEGNLVVPRGVKFLGDGKGAHSLLAVPAGESG